MELDLVTALTAANITVLQPSHIQQQDKPVDVPYLFVRLISVVYIQPTTICILASSFHYMLLHNIQFIIFNTCTILSSQAKYARIIFLNMYENKATEILCHVSINQPRSGSLGVNICFSVVYSLLLQQRCTVLTFYVLIIRISYLYNSLKTWTAGLTFNLTKHNSLC